MAPGWAQQSVQVPTHFREIFRLEASERGHSSIKHLGTLATGLLLGMPPRARQALYVWISTMRAEEMRDLQPEQIYEAFARIMRVSNEPPDEKEVAWLVTRILDPRISLPPSERPQQEPPEERKGAG